MDDDHIYIYNIQVLLMLIVVENSCYCNCCFVQSWLTTVENCKQWRIMAHTTCAITFHQTVKPTFPKLLVRQQSNLELLPKAQLATFACKKIWDYKFRVAENGFVQKICHPQTKHHVVFAVDFLGFYRSQNTTTSKLVPCHRDIPNCPLSTGVLHHGNRPQMQTERLTTWWWPTNTWFQSWHQSQVLQHTLLEGWRYDCLGVAVVINLKDGNVVFSYVGFL